MGQKMREYKRQIAQECRDRAEFAGILKRQNLSKEFTKKMGNMIKIAGIFNDLAITRLIDSDPSIEFYKMLKRRVTKLYEEIYATSRWKQQALFIYKRTAIAPPDYPEEIAVTWEEKVFLDRIIRKNNTIRTIYGAYNFEYLQDYRISNKDQHILFEPDEHHLNMLKKLNRLKSLGRSFQRTINDIRRKLGRTTY